MKNLLISQKLHKALVGKEQKPVCMKDENLEEFDLEARAAIILCLERMLHSWLMKKQRLLAYGQS